MTNYLVLWALKRIKRNKNVIIVINGATGSGKTYAAIDLGMKIAQANGTQFDIKNNMDFKFTDLLKKMSLSGNTKPGTVFIFEEVGAAGGGASASEWQSRANTFFNSFMQTSRHKNQILIFTCPHFGMLDAKSRSLVHCQCNMLRINTTENKSYLKPYMLQVNTRTGIIFYKLMRVTHTGSTKKLGEQSFDLPPKDVLDVYEHMKTQYTNKLNQRIILEEEVSERRREKRYKPVIDNILIERYKSEGLSYVQIAEKLGTTVQTIYNKRKAGQKVKKSKSEKTIIANLLGNNINKTYLSSILT